MAKIEMDMTEYKLMEQKASLLEKAVSRNEAYNLEILALKDEKIKLLRGNDKMVTIEVLKRTSETKLTYHNPDIILQRLRANEKHVYNKESFYTFLDTFFETKTHEFTTDRTVTRKGLDEVTRDIKKELKKSLSEDTKRDLDTLSDIKKELQIRNEELQKANKILVIRDKEITGHLDQIKLLRKKIVKLEESSTRYKKYILNIVHNVPKGLWFRKRLIKILENEDSRF